MMPSTKVLVRHEHASQELHERASRLHEEATQCVHVDANDVEVGVHRYGLEL